MITETFILPEDRLRISDLFRVLQEIAGNAVVSWHATGPELKEKGLMWVVIRYELTLERALQPGESIRVSTWASPVRHRMSQRNYLLFDGEGLQLGRAAGIWALVDRETRAMVEPEGRGIAFQTEETGLEPPRPSAPEKMAIDSEFRFTVSDQVLDINDHMNNTRYFDVAEDSLGSDAEGLVLTRVRAAFLSEARAGDELLISRGRSGSSFYFSGTKNGEHCFQIGLDYE